MADVTSVKGTHAGTQVPSSRIQVQQQIQSKVRRAQISKGIADQARQRAVATIRGSGNRPKANVSRSSRGRLDVVA